MDKVPQPDANDGCLATPTSVLVDGANATCERPNAARAIDHGALLFACVATLATTLAFTVVRRRRTRAVAFVALVVCAAATVPGLYAVALRRADRPGRRAETTQLIDHFASQLSHYAQSHTGCVAVVDEGCTECVPIAHYALFDPRACMHPSGHVYLRPNGLARGCAIVGDSLVCGDRP